MAATLSLTQLSSGNPIYDKFYRQVDPTGSGRVTAADAALFLKRSGLADLVLGKIWDLSDSERKGALSKQQFFIALRLVACAQNGLEVALKSLNVAVPPPKFPVINSHLFYLFCFSFQPEEKIKFDSIFDSLGPVGGMLTGDKVKPVLLNSKLTVDILGRVWELSDLDRDGMLDKDEFSVAMYLVYRALEGEPVPMSLPPPLVPPSKRKKPSVPPVMPLLPSPPSVKDSRSSHSVLSSVQWAVSAADKTKSDELFNKTDGDMDGLVSGPEVRDIFLKTGLPSATLARIWELCDIGDIGKLTREQFALALHLITQKLTKGLDPPQSLTPEMIPPSDRQNIKQNNMVNLAADFSAIKELDSLSNEIVELQREKSSVEEEIKEKEEAIRLRSSEVQDLQDEVARESEELQRLQTQRQRVQEMLEELDQQKCSLEEQLTHIRQQTTQETQLISSLQSEHEEQEQRICEYEEELVQAREELLALQEESRRLQEKVQAAQEQLTPLQDSVRDSFLQVAQVGFPAENITCSPVTIQQVESADHENKQEQEPAESQEPTTSALPGGPMPPQTSPPSLPEMDFFHSDPFTDHPFGGDPFKGTDPFAADTFFTQTSSAPFSSEDPFSASADPFGTTTGMPEPDLFAAKLNNAASAPAAGLDPFISKPTNPASSDQFTGQVSAAAEKDTAAANDPFAPGGTAVSSSSDPDPFAAMFGSESFGGGFADFSALTKSNGADQFGINNKNLFQEDSPSTCPDVPPALPPKTGTPTRPPPPPPGQHMFILLCLNFVNCVHLFVFVCLLPLHLCFVFPSCVCVCVCVCVCFFMEQYPTEEDMIEWAKRESEREEKERLARLTQQEQEDLELAIALSKSELS
uniref:Epidermal growth factor receptor pathway substrate 15 n=1 Tax=Scophthalmus maximus TaxID=52904 RepID=A0A8D3DS71_SCOMX